MVGNGWQRRYGHSTRSVAGGAAGHAGDRYDVWRRARRPGSRDRGSRGRRITYTAIHLASDAENDVIRTGVVNERVVTRYQNPYLKPETLGLRQDVQEKSVIIQRPGTLMYRARRTVRLPRSSYSAYRPAYGLDHVLHLI